MPDYNPDFEVARDRLAEANGLEPCPDSYRLPIRRDAAWEAWRRFFAARMAREGAQIMRIPAHDSGPDTTHAGTAPSPGIGGTQ